uniref:Uncharacterized protein n=1 Tax=Anguilla anguilla TaxID=7936 RepID=A0A0E9SQ23_ANGAN
MQCSMPKCVRVTCLYKVPEVIIMSGAR